MASHTHTTGDSPTATPSAEVDYQRAFLGLEDGIIAVARMAAAMRLATFAAFELERDHAGELIELQVPRRSLDAARAIILHVEDMADALDQRFQAVA